MIVLFAFIAGVVAADCLHSYTCSDCTANATCHWCASNSTGYRYSVDSVCTESITDCAAGYNATTNNVTCAYDILQRCSGHYSCSSCLNDTSCQWCQSQDTTATNSGFGNTCAAAGIPCGNSTSIFNSAPLTGITSSSLCYYDLNSKYRDESDCTFCTRIGGGVWCGGTSAFGNNYTGAGTCNYGSTCLAPNARATPVSTSSACPSSSSSSSSGSVPFYCGGQPIDGLASLGIIFGLLGCLQMSNPMCTSGLSFSGGSVNATQMMQSMPTQAQNCQCAAGLVKCLGMQSPPCQLSPEAYAACKMNCTAAQCDSSIPLLSVGVLLVAFLRALY